MKRFLVWPALLAAALLSIPRTVVADEALKAKMVPWDLSHLYVYDYEGVMDRVVLVNKVAVRFIGEMTEEKKRQFLGERGAVSFLPDREDKSLFIMLLPAEITPSGIIKLLREISGSGIATADPVVIRDNMEAIAEGLEVRPKTYMSSEVLMQRLQKFGVFKVRQAKETKEGFRITIDSIDPPLNVYLLANLVSKDSWVSGAFPMFRYLEQPISAFIRVEPVTGTLAEIRRVTLEIKILDNRYNLREDLLNRFGEGKNFIPKSANSPPSRMLFYILGEGQNLDQACQCEKRDARQGRARVITFSWRFKHYEVGKEEGKPNQGEWTIGSPTIVFERGVEVLEITAPPVTFAVMSLIGSVSIPDVPPPLPVFIHGSSDKVEAAAEPFNVPQYWFDRWKVGDFTFTEGQLFLSLLLATIAIAGYMLFGPVVRSIFRRLTGMWYAMRYADDLGKKARFALYQSPADAYTTLFELTSSLLAAACDLPAHPTLEDVEAKREEISREMLEWAAFIFRAHEEKLKPSFNPDPRTVRAMHEAFEKLLMGMRPKLGRKEICV